MPCTSTWTWRIDGNRDGIDAPTVNTITLGAKGGVYWGYYEGGRRGRWSYWWNPDLDEHTYIIEFGFNKIWKKHVFTSRDTQMLELASEHMLYNAENLWDETSIKHNNGDRIVQMIRV